MTNYSFQAPSPLWKWVLYPLSILSILFSLYIFFVFANAAEKTMFLKIELILGYFSLFASIYLLAAYRYLCWAAEAKQLLLELLQTHPHLLYENEDGIYLFNEQALAHAGYAKEDFVAMNQDDLKDVRQASLA